MATELEAWQNFYVMVGGAAAALTGLVLVALSLHLRAILRHPLYRDRAFTSLQGFVTIILVATAALAPQSLTALGAELALVGLFWLVKLARFVQLFRGMEAGQRGRAVYGFEWVAWVLWTLAFGSSGLLLLAGDARALFIIAIAVAAGAPLIVWNVWVLMTAVSE